MEDCSVCKDSIMQDSVQQQKPQNYGEVNVQYFDKMNQDLSSSKRQFSQCQVHSI